MFGLFLSQSQKLRRNAQDWLETAEKVWNYRHDVLPAADLTALNAARADLAEQLKTRADAAKLKLSIEKLEALLRRVGGEHYPRGFIAENIEFLLVATIVILGLRAYVVQPFKIPTNSMWPSYYGLTHEIFAQPADEPNTTERAFRFLAFGASPRRIDAPASGEILLPLGNGQQRGVLSYVVTPAKTWLIFPTQRQEYSFFVGASRVTVSVPIDYDMDWTVRDTFFPDDRRPLAEIVRERQAAGQYIDTEVQGRPVRMVRTGKIVRKDERMMSFDVMTGDQLFVDRISYHFVPPQVGDGFVFRTGNIRDLATKGGDQYYIKRLVGLPGDTLRIQDFTLHRNGQPITGSAAFAKNAQRVDRYVGYRQEGLMRNGASITLHDSEYLALGDNSANSLDGRYWGAVPGPDIVGRPIFIYYPFTKRWGRAP
jgi:signal peptidase I